MGPIGAIQRRARQQVIDCRGRRERADAQGQSLGFEMRQLRAPNGGRGGVEAGCERRGARGERREARGERREARDERRETRGCTAQYGSTAGDERLRHA